MDHNPVIILPDIGQSRINEVDGKGETIKSVWPFKLDEKALMNDLKSSILKMALFRKDGGFSDKIAGMVESIAEPWGVKPDGAKKHSVKAVAFDKPLSEGDAAMKKAADRLIPVNALEEKIGGDKIFFFAYDSFGDLFDVTDELDAFVNSVKEQTSSEKVNFLCVGLSGGLLRAYLMKYGKNGGVGKIVSMAAALDGSELIADLFEDKLNLEDPMSLLGSLGGRAASLTSLAKMMPREVIDNVISKSLKTARENLLYSCTSMWALVPNSRFESVYEVRKAAGMDSVLDSKIKAFHDYTAEFAKEAEVLKNEYNTEFYQICGCGKQLMPAVKSEFISSDGIVDIHSASLGIKQCAFEDEPDASTALFPDTTWLFKGQSHGNFRYNDAAASLAVKILAGEIETVSSDEGYPQINGSRSIKKLETSLIPKAKKKAEETEDETLKSSLTQCMEEYETILSDTVIKDDSAVKTLEEKLEGLLAETAQE